MKLGGDKHRFDQTKVEGYCYEVVEEHEEVTTEAMDDDDDLHVVCLEM
jgi:hypothetical protein